MTIRFIESNKVSELMEPPSIEGQASAGDYRHVNALLRQCTHGMVRQGH